MLRSRQRSSLRSIAGLVLTVIAPIQRIQCQNITASVGDLMNLSTHLSFYLILVENIVKKRRIQTVLMRDVTYYVILEVVLLVI